MPAIAPLERPLVDEEVGPAGGSEVDKERAVLEAAVANVDVAGVR